MCKETEDESARVWGVFMPGADVVWTVGREGSAEDFHVGQGGHVMDFKKIQLW